MLTDTVNQLKQRKTVIRSEIAKLNAEDRMLDRAINVLSTLFVSESALVAKPVKKKGKISAAGRKALSLAMKARWAKKKAGKIAPVAEPAKKRTMSPAHRRAVVKAQKARWAKIKAAKATPVATTPASTKPATPTKKRKMSAAGRAAIIAAQKARWAKIKTEKTEAAVQK